MVRHDEQHFRSHQRRSRHLTAGPGATKFWVRPRKSGRIIEKADSVDENNSIGHEHTSEVGLFNGLQSPHCTLQQRSPSSSCKHTAKPKLSILGGQDTKKRMIEEYARESLDYSATVWQQTTKRDQRTLRGGERPWMREPSDLVAVGSELVLDG